MRAITILATCLGLLVSGCNTTKYDSTWQGGVEAERIDTTRYLVTAEGNRWTSPRTIEEFALLKAAETAAADGKVGFAIVDADVRTVTTTSQWGSTGPHTATVEMEIEVFDAVPANVGKMRYFDAAKVLKAFGPKHLPKS